MGKGRPYTAARWRFIGPVAVLVFLLWSSCEPTLQSDSANADSDAAVLYAFKHYKPSALESVWAANSVELSKELCGHLADYIRDGYIDRWIAASDDVKSLRPPFEQIADPLFSAYTFTGSDGSTRVQYLEPLALALRHPKAFCNDDGTYLCRSYNDCRARKEIGMPHAFRRDWLVVNPPVNTGGKAMLFDLGCSWFTSGPGGPSSLWFVEQYEKVGAPALFSRCCCQLLSSF
jgi:hypothetical protein